MVALIALLGISAVPACSSNIERAPSSSSGKTTSDKTGALGLELKIGGGVILSTVSYTVSGNGITPITGSIPVDASGATASVLIGALPAGTGYTITMSGTSTDGVTTCTGSAKFNVTAGQTVGVQVPLNCGAPTTRGNVTANGTFNTCPVITSMIVAPLQLDVGGNINVSAAGSDVDPGTTLTFAWTATPNGSFANPASASTTFLCASGGTKTVTVTISDGNGCTTSLSGDVLCTTSAVCGDGVAETTKGEQCDPPNGVTCDANCQTISIVCGNSIVQPGEQCDPPNNTTCNNSCQNIVCGDGKTEGAEQCDPPNGTTCDSSCKTIATVCGNGIVQPGEQCDDGNTVSGDGCSSTCKLETCSPCITKNCAGPQTACQAHEPGCDNVLACIASTGCAVGSTRDGAECYCGALDNDTCFNSFDPTVPQGPCKAAINTAAGTTLPLQVGQVFFDTTTSVGAAMQTVSCELRSCKTECSL